MENIKDYLKNNILLADGAMGTYYNETTGNSRAFPEVANIEDYKTVVTIHREYIAAGAKLIRTNTFSANSFSLRLDRNKIREIIKSGISAAKESGGNDIYIAASIGPIPESVDGKEKSEAEIIDEYLYICELFLKNGINIFIFETFGEYGVLAEVHRKIKELDENTFVVMSFSVNSSGLSRKGIGLQRLVNDSLRDGNIDLVGFNCGTGPKHLFNNVKKLNLQGNSFSIMPNSGFPEVVNERLVYFNNPNYFAEVTGEFVGLGAVIAGGCCGTTPEHIKHLNGIIAGKKYRESEFSIDTQKKVYKDALENKLISKAEKNEFVIAVELDPPFGTDLSKLKKGAAFLKDKGVDIITVADSPLGKVRNNPIITAASIKRESKIDVMPHLACRDRNIIALKSDIMAGYAERIRNIMIVTGDPVSDADRADVKGVFNLNSVRFIELVRELEREVTGGKMFGIGAALNVNVVNQESETRKTEKKIEAGADFFFTQPIYDERSIEYLAELKKKFDTKIFAGIMPFVSYRNARFVANEIPGMKIPAEYVEMFTETMSKEEAEETGIEIVTKICREIRGIADGFYFIAPFNRYEMIGKILDRLK